VQRATVRRDEKEDDMTLLTDSSITLNYLLLSLSHSQQRTFTKTTSHGQRVVSMKQVKSCNIDIG
jgi:hypothetical protein